MGKMSELEDWISATEAAKFAGYHLNHIRRLLQTGVLEGRKWGQAWMINRESLLTYLKKVETQGEKRGPKSETPNSKFG